jgi:hypothetical protein
MQKAILYTVSLILAFYACKKVEPVKPVNTGPPLITDTAPTITVTGVIPQSAVPGDTIIITGTNFLLNPAKDTVLFGSIRATIVKATADTLNVIVPAGFITAFVTVNGVFQPSFEFSALTTDLKISGVYPGWGKQGDTIKISGAHFNTDPLKDTVSISGIIALVEKATSDTLWVIVPLTSTGIIIVNGVSTMIPAFVYAPSVFITTIAGTGKPSEPGSQTDEGLALQTDITPELLCFDKLGNLYFSERGRIRELSGGQITTFAGVGSVGNINGPNLQASFNTINGMVFDAMGNMYVSESSDNLIRKISNGNVTLFAGGYPGGSVDGQDTLASFYSPGSLAADPQNNIYVAEAGAIREITPSGQVSTFSGKGASLDTSYHGVPGSGYNQPGYKLYLDNWDGQGASARFEYITCLISDPAGNLYANDSYRFDCIRKITPSAQVTTITCTTQGFSTNNSAITIDATENIYVSYYNPIGFYSIEKRTPGGTETVIAGAQFAHYNTDYIECPAEFAQFSKPVSLAVDATGNLYIADGNRIRKITFQ